MSSPISLIDLARFTLESSQGGTLHKRETSRVEFKQTFHAQTSSLVAYIKTLASFANNSGGIIIFGVGDRPRTLVGIDKAAFDGFEPTILEQLAISYFSPRLDWFIDSIEYDGKFFGIIGVSTVPEKPHLCVNTYRDEVREGMIYYRYNGNNKPIRYGEFFSIIESVKDGVRQKIFSQINRMEIAGPDNTAVLDMSTGKISGSSGALFVDRDLLSQVAIINSGNFKENGKPALKLIGEVQPVEVRLTDNPNAPQVQVSDTEFHNIYPLTHADVIAGVKNLVDGVKIDKTFNNIKDELRRNAKFAGRRTLNPAKPNSLGQWFYSPHFVEEMANLLTANTINEG